MSEMSTTVRRTETKRTPKWARTADGIVLRWQSGWRNLATLSALSLNARLLQCFTINCCRSARIWASLSDERSTKILQDALERTEQFLDGWESEEAIRDLNSLLEDLSAENWNKDPNCPLTVAWAITYNPKLSGDRRVRLGWVKGLVATAVKQVGQRVPKKRVRQHLNPTGVRRAGQFSNSAAAMSEYEQKVVAEEAAERTRQGQLLAGIVGPGWHLAPEWRTDTAVQIARGIYENRDFGAMPILADALNDAGCDNEGWLARLRDPEWPWCRGCHVLDSLLPELVHRGA